MSIVEEGVDFLVENGVNDLEKYNTDDITLSVNSQGVLSRSLGQEQMVGCVKYLAHRLIFLSPVLNV